jgi:hypothetical protein
MNCKNRLDVTAEIPDTANDSNISSVTVRIGQSVESGIIRDVADMVWSQIVLVHNGYKL